jgi:hypothetical protein
MKLNVGCGKTKSQQLETEIIKQVYDKIDQLQCD